MRGGKIMKKKESESSKELEFLRDALKATYNILEDFADEKMKLEEFRKATINILEDFNEEKNTVRKYNEELKNEISERMKTEQQLKMLNRELEGFSYSISHDLRAPLRAIQGYSRIMVEQYADNLDQEGRELMKDILRNSANMGQLIDDILHFSRLSRKETNFGLIDMTDLFRRVYDDIYFKDKNPNLLCNIHQLPTAHADLVLIKQVVINLVSNAIKYSSREEKPYIEVNGEEKENESIYWVSDNGVGFDMKYKDKLFGVFQRLHRAEEFEGTGVGLAIVNRIIEKHGGRVWAESEIDKGATFFFSLPKKYTEYQT